MDDIFKYDREAIKVRLRAVRKAKGLTQDEVGDRIGYHRNTILNWEKVDDKAFPTLDDMLRLCNIFDCNLSYLLCEQECKIKDHQAIADYTGLTEEAIETLHGLTLLGNDKADGTAQLKAINALLSGEGLVFIAYVYFVERAISMSNARLKDISLYEDAEDFATINEIIQELEQQKNHLDFMENNSIEHLQDFYDCRFKMKETRKALMNEYDFFLKKW